MPTSSRVTPISDRQPAAKNVRGVDDRQLPLVEKGDPIDVPMSLILKQRSLSAAIALCVQITGRDDKEIYLSLGIDAGHWSRILKGDAHFPVDRLGALMDLCGNEAPLLWLARSRGYELRPLETELERQVRILREKNDAKEAENKLLRGLLVGRAMP